jgi:hypothetical protein
MAHSPERIALIQQVIPLLWNYPQGIPKKQWCGSYGSKHGVEHALGFYITNDEFIQAAVEMGIQHEKGDPNYRFGMKPRFPTNWFQLDSRRLSHRPHGETQKKWDAYLDACKEIDRIVHSLIKDDTSDDSRYTKLTKVVGHWTPRREILEHPAVSA